MAGTSLPIVVGAQQAGREGATAFDGRRVRGKILLVKPPFFTPWTPPLGIAILKAFVEQHGYSARCVDLNTDPELWGTHHKYFTALQTLEDISINDGYSKLWWIFNAHLLAALNGATKEQTTRLLNIVIPMYGVRCTDEVIRLLLPLVDRFFRRISELIDQIDLTGYEVVGTSSYTTSLSSSLFLLREIKRKHPEIRTVMGGGIFADDLAQGSDNLETLLREYPFVDNVVLGEGELLFLKLLNGDLAHNRVISINDISGTTMSMSDVPVPDFSNLDLEPYYHLTIEGARSCPFQCSFCSETVQWGDYRKKPGPVFAKQMIELSKRYNNKSFFLGDSLMNPYITSLWPELVKENAAVLFDGYLRADKIATNRPRTKDWARSGMYRVRLGIESASARILGVMDKMTTPVVISEALKSLASAGIRTTTYWIVGFPSETEEDFQETIEFVRAHHKYIYELEAHPYYYYPYGQIGSRLFQCYSLYPKEVTDLIKFQVWDIVDGKPTREERYDRLRRMSAFAAELGLPNIYTMSERYVAEERWQRLWPLAVEVYQGAHNRRSAFASSSQPTHNDLPPGGVLLDPVLCYRVRVNKDLDTAQVAAAGRELIRFNEALSLGFTEDPANVADDSLVTVIAIDQGPSESLDAGVIDEIDRLAVSFTGEEGPGLHLLLVKGRKQPKGEYCDILLIAKRTVTDAAGLMLLVEDLFRIYEQLSIHRQVTLLPVDRNYSEFLELNWRLDNSAGSNDEHGQASAVVVKLPETLATELLKSDAMTMASVPSLLVNVLFSSLRKSGLPVHIDAAIDYRLLDRNFSRTVGPMTRVSALSNNALSSLYPHRVLTTPDPNDGCQPLWSDTEGGGISVLLNMEYLRADPWVGNDEWSPQGFVRPKSRGSAAHALEIVAVRCSSGIEVRYTHRRPELHEVVQHMADSLVDLLQRQLEDECHREAARRFWSSEMKRHTAIENFQVHSDLTTREGFESISCLTTSVDLMTLSSNLETSAEAVLLAACAALLSRYLGQEYLLLIISMSCNSRYVSFPLTLPVRWDDGFGEFAKMVQSRIDAASPHAPYALEMLRSDRGIQAYSELPPFACCFGETLSNDLNAADFDIIIHVRQIAPECKVDLLYEKTRLDQGAAVTLAGFFSAILVSATGNLDLPLGDIAPDKRSDGLLQASTSVAELERDFSF